MDEDDIPVMLELDEALRWVDGLGRVLTVDEVGTISSRLGRNSGPALLVELMWRDGLTRDAAVGHVAAVWTAAEYPQDALDEDDWFTLFEMAGYTIDDGVSAERPALPLRLYRGAPAERRHRMSWTSDPDLAGRFASAELRGREDGRVWTAVITEPWRLLAACNQRSEHEFVIDTAGLAIELWTGSATGS